MARFDKVLVTSPPEHRVTSKIISLSKLLHLLQQMARPALNPPFHKFHSLCTIGDEAHNIACNIVKELKWDTNRHTSTHSASKYSGRRMAKNWLDARG
jgi:hypothetical protein